MMGKAKWMSIVTALGVGLALAGRADAGDPQGRRGHRSVAERVQQMRERLGLSDDQARRIEHILDQAAAQGETDRTRLREHRQQVRGQIQAVLTEEQKAKAAELRRERRPRRQHEPTPPPPQD
jgi:Spy/CpxP family protein refolding chaperone